jgi:hypothetical protein
MKEKLNIPGAILFGFYINVPVIETIIATINVHNKNQYIPGIAGIVFMLIIGFIGVCCFRIRN